MGHLIRVFGQDWYRLAAPERAGRPLGDVLPDWVDPRPVCFTQPPPRNPPPQTSGSSASSAAKCWSTGTKASSSTAPPRPRPLLNVVKCRRVAPNLATN
jgi:hypothetical protein